MPFPKELGFKTKKFVYEGNMDLSENLHAKFQVGFQCDS